MFCWIGRCSLISSNEPSRDNIVFPDETLTATITNIQHFSIGDGPGIRTTVFFKGCNLKCLWCHNPETIAKEKQLLFYSALCKRCGSCEKVCPANAINVCEEGTQLFRDRCLACGKCTAVCPAKALVLTGRTVTVQDVWSEIQEDLAFYRNSGGGVTLSGGEPLLQPLFVREVAKVCRQNGVSVILDTAGNVPTERFTAVLPFIDEFYFDVKAPSEETYRTCTGGSLSLTLQNIRYLISQKAAVTIRIPVIPGVTESEEACRQIAEALRETGAKTVNLLPFHRYGKGKYQALGRSDPYGDHVPPSSETMARLKKIFEPYFDVSVKG